MGVQLFGGMFYKCVDVNKTRIIGSYYNKTVCKLHEEQFKNVSWINSAINFDSFLMGYLALFQVVSVADSSQKDWQRFFLVCRSVRMKSFFVSCNLFYFLLQATNKGWIEIMADAVDTTDVSSPITKKAEASTEFHVASQPTLTIITVHSRLAVHSFLRVLCLTPSTSSS